MERETMNTSFRLEADDYAADDDEDTQPLAAVRTSVTSDTHDPTVQALHPHRVDTPPGTITFRDRLVRRSDHSGIQPPRQGLGIDPVRPTSASVVLPLEAPRVTAPISPENILLSPSRRIEITAETPTEPGPGNPVNMTWGLSLIHI